MKLSVRVIEARDLPSMDLNGFSDPYVRIQLGRKKFRSKVVKKSLNPSWNEEFSFRVEDLSEEITLSVMDEDKYFNDDFVGQLKVPVSRVFDAENKTLGPEWFPLLPKNKKSRNRECGEIRLSMSLSQNNLFDQMPNDSRSSTGKSLVSSDSPEMPSKPEDRDNKFEDPSYSWIFDEAMKYMESRDQGEEMPSNLPGGVVVDQSYVISPADLNSLIFSPSSEFLKSLAELQGTTDLQEGPWTLENSGERLKRVVTYKKAPTKLIKSYKATEEQIYLKADGRVFAVLATVSTPDVPFGTIYRTELLFCIMPGPELRSGEQSSRLVISWRVKFLQSTMMKGMIEGGARQGLKDSYGWFADLLSRTVKPIDSKKLGGNKNHKLRVAVLATNAAVRFMKALTPKEVKAAGFAICANKLRSIVEDHDLNKLNVHGGVEGIANKLSTSTTDGISTTEDDVKRRQTVYGINKFAESQVWSFWVFVLEALQDMTLMILVVCAFVSLIVGIVMEGWANGAHDGLGIVSSILLVVFVTAMSDYWQSLQFKDLDKEKEKNSIQVTQNGYRQKISISDLLPGDIVHLAIGDRVPADGLFVSGFSVLINESSLTGESEPVVVNAENPFLLSGTKVQDGSCKMLVTTVGMRTQWGKLMAILSEGGDDETPLQVKLNGVATIIGKIGLFFAVVTFAVLVRGLFSRKLKEGTHWSLSGNEALEMLEYFAVAVTIVVIAVPEGLPLAVTLSLSFAMKKMINDKALVRHLAACEAMGSATSICSDKTGTLTTNHMTVVKTCICGNIKEVSNSKDALGMCSEIPDVAVKMLLQSIFNNTGGEVVINENGKKEILGTPTEAALLEFGMLLGGDFQAVRRESKLVKVEPFNSEKKRMGVVLQLSEGGFRAHSKGASEIILAACNKVIDPTGQVIPLDEAALIHLKETIESFANEALRTLCLAYMEMGTDFLAKNPIPLRGYTCIGIVGIKDPVRPGVKESVGICKSAGITVRMVTGDNINTAKAIARNCGIFTDEGVAIEGPEFREKSVEELMDLIPRIQVMARSSPLDKHSLVKHLRTVFNEVVAVTGDGTNDAPALHEADIGFAMGIAGTEVAKESADVIIMNDSFSTIVTVAKWGRSVYVNIQKIVQFQLTVNVVALIVNFSSAFLTGNAPLTPVQLLWVNMIMDTLGALALATEPPKDELMKRQPVGRNGNFISNVMWRNILGQSFYQFIVIWYLQTEGKGKFQLAGPDSDLILNTLIFNSFVFCQVFNEISCREMEKINVFEGMLKNYVFVDVLICTVVFQVIIIEFLGDFAKTTPLTLTQWFSSVLIGFLGVPIAAAIKMIPVG